MRRTRMVRDRDLAPEVLAEKQRRSRRYEIEVATLTAVIKGVSVHRLLTARNGLRPKPGSSEPDLIRTRFAYYQAQKQVGKLPATLKDAAQLKQTIRAQMFDDWAKQSGVIIERTNAELMAEQRQQEQTIVLQCNRDRAELDMKPVRIVEEAA